MRFIVDKLEVLIFEFEYVFDLWVKSHLGQFERLSFELNLCLMDMIQIKMGVSQSQSKLARFIVGDLSNHHS